MNDESSNQQKSAPAWWWRDKDFLEKFSHPNSSLAAYRYELGRRYHKYQNKNLHPRYKPLSEILRGDSDIDGKIKYELIACFDLEKFDSGVLATWPPLKLSKSDIKKAQARVGGKWVQPVVFAWNLECPWKRVANILKWHFEKQKDELGIKTDAQSRKIQKPKWELLEVWDNWWADIVTFKTPEAHQRKTYEIARSAKSFAGPADEFLETLREYGYIK